MEWVIVGKMQLTDYSENSLKIRNYLFDKYKNIKSLMINLVQNTNHLMMSTHHQKDINALHLNNFLSTLIMPHREGWQYMAGQQETVKVQQKSGFI